MKLLALTLVCCFAFAGVLATEDTEIGNEPPRILGGTEQIENGKKPWMVFITVVDAADATVILQTCSGSIVNNLTVITAAQCLIDLLPAGASAAQIKMYIGDVDHTAVDPATTAKNYSLNASFFVNSDEFDIAVITLSAEVLESDKVKYILLPTKTQTKDSFENKTAIAYGWGVTAKDGTEASAKFSYVEMKVLMQKECKTKMKETSYKVYDAMICTDTLKHTTGICKFDAGGPLTMQLKSGSMPTLVGVASFFDACETDYPNVFTRLTAKDVLKWIAKNGGPPEPK